MDDLPPAIDTIDYGLYMKGKTSYHGERPFGMPRYIPEDFFLFVRGRMMMLCQLKLYLFAK